MKPPCILVLDHEQLATEILETVFGRRIRIVGAQTVAAAELVLASEQVAVLVCRDDMPNESGLMFLSRHHDAPPWQRCILLCPPLDIELARHLINKTDIFRCVELPLNPAQLNQMVGEALEKSLQLMDLVDAQVENTQLRQRLRSRRRHAQDVSASWIRALPRLVMLATFTFIGVALLGAATLLILYLLKSVLGIDLFANAHLSDAL
jgi:DNA-binding NtrC family response regulator